MWRYVDFGLVTWSQISRLHKASCVIATTASLCSSHCVYECSAKFRGQGLLSQWYHLAGSKEGEARIGKPPNDHSPKKHSRVKSNRSVSSRHRPFLPFTHFEVQHRADSKPLSHDNSKNRSFKIKSVHYQDDKQDICKKEKKTAKTTCQYHVATRLAVGLPD